MEEEPSPFGQELAIPPAPVEEVLDPKALKADLKDNERKWSTAGDSETLWEVEHELLLKLQRAGDNDTILKRAKKEKKALKPKGSAAELAQASLSLWVLERFPESEAVLRVAFQRLPQNRYPWSLLLRHLSWEKDPGEAIEFIGSSLGDITWKAYAYIQLGTLCIDAASRAYKAEEMDTCDKYVAEARTYLGQVREHPDCTPDMERTADRLMILVDTLQTRSANARASGITRPPMEDEINYGAAQLERDMRDVADASGVSLEGEPDEQLDINDLEREAMFNMPDDDKEERFTVLEVTPSEGIGLIRKKKPEK